MVVCVWRGGRRKGGGERGEVWVGGWVGWRGWVCVCGRDGAMPGADDPAARRQSSVSVELSGVPLLPQPSRRSSARGDATDGAVAHAASWRLP